MEGEVLALIQRKVGLRYLGDKANLRLHDLTQESESCDIDGLIQSGNAVGFSPDSILVAMAHGYAEAHDCVVRRG